MLRIVIIGGTGHVGTYLVPRLVHSGYEVISISRGESKPYRYHPAWESVEHVKLDRDDQEAAGDFAERVRSLRPDVVIDMICFELESARQLVEALRGHVHHLLHCGTFWVHGHSIQVPTTEDQPRYPFGKYGTQKAQIEDYLLDEARRHGFPATVLHPGHIVGAGWVPVNPAGNFNPEVFERLARGEELTVPNLDGDTPSRPCRRRGTGLRAGAGQLECRGGGELPRGLAGGADAQRLRGGGSRLVRESRPPKVRPVGRVA